MEHKKKTIADKYILYYLRRKIQSNQNVIFCFVPTYIFQKILLRIIHLVYMPIILWYNVPTVFIHTRVLQSPVSLFHELIKNIPSTN